LPFKCNLQRYSAAAVAKDHGNIDILIHSLANGPEVQKPLLETSRNGYLAAVSASAYSKVSLLQRFGPMMNKGGACISLTYLASEKIIPGYGGGMSSAKAALESDTQVLAYEAGHKWGVRVNTISAGPLGSRAAKAIGFIDDMINYSMSNVGGCTTSCIQLTHSSKPFYLSSETVLPVK
jgi:enoyl-[acyl-carrier protein] reductase I